MASPTLRSSSSTAPGPSLSSSPMCMRARPSTADTCTGTSNTASRSAAPRLTSPLSAGAREPASSTVGMSLPASSSGSGTLVSLSLIAWLSRIQISLAHDLVRFPSFGSCAWHGAGSGRYITADRVIDCCERGSPVARHTAVGPFDAAVAGRKGGLGQNHQPAFEAARLRDLVELDLCRLENFGADMHNHVRRLDQMIEAVFGQRR